MLGFQSRMSKFPISTRDVGIFRIRKLLQKYAENCRIRKQTKNRLAITKLSGNAKIGKKKNPHKTSQKNAENEQKCAK